MRYLASLQNIQPKKALVVLSGCVILFSLVNYNSVNSTSRTSMVDGPQSMANEFRGSILLSAPQIVLTEEDEQTNIQARIRDERGKPVPGVNVQFSASSGSFTSTDVPTDGQGIAHAVWSKGAASGLVVVSAESGELSERTMLEVRRTAISEPSIELSIEGLPDELLVGQSVPLAISMMDGNGTPLVGEPVTLFGSLGMLSAASGVTDANGMVQVIFAAGNSAGTSNVTAIANYQSIQSSIRIVGNDSTPTPGATPSLDEENSQSLNERLFLPVVSNRN